MSSLAGKVSMLVDEYNHSKNSPVYRKLLIKYKALKESNKELVRLLTNVFSASIAATNIPETETADTDDEEEPPKHKKKSRRKKLRKNVQKYIVAEEEDVYEDPNNNVSALCDDLGELNIREEPEHKIEVEDEETPDVAVETEEPAEVETEEPAEVEPEEPAEVEEVETEEFVEVEETTDASVETEEPTKVETEEFIEVEEIGSSKWMKQHEYIEKLNLQVHSFILPLRLIYIIILIIIHTDGSGCFYMSPPMFGFFYNTKLFRKCFTIWITINVFTFTFTQPQCTIFTNFITIQSAI
jgi:hypothetical protein